MYQRFVLITVIGVKCHSQDPRVGEIYHVRVRDTLLIIGIRIS